MVPRLPFSNPYPLCLCDLCAGQYIDSESKGSVFCCDKLINVVKGLDFVLLFVGLVLLLVKWSFYFRH